MSTVKVFKCNGCGAPLPIPKNSKGHVKCPSCKTECVIEGLVKNAEMADKENINSGFPLTATPAALHRHLVSFLFESPTIPVDVFEKGEVVREEHYCVPSYLFYCNGTASFTYEAGNVRQHKTAIDLGDRTRVETQNYMEWTQMSGTANASATLFTSGNRAAAFQVEELYMFLDPNELIDFDELDFPPDVVTYDYNLPQAASFNEYVRPHMEELLEKKARESLKGRDTKNLSMGGGCRIDKDEIVRVFLGLYRVVFRYGEKEYPVWVTGDGEDAFHEGMPEDTQRDNILEGKKQSMEQAVASIPVPKTGGLTAGIDGCILVAAFSLVSIVIGVFPTPIGIIGAIIASVGAIVFGVQSSKKKAPYNAECAEVRAKFQKEIDDFESQVPNLIQQFKAQKKALRGIYTEVTGDASAF